MDSFSLKRYFLVCLALKKGQKKIPTVWLVQMGLLERNRQIVQDTRFLFCFWSQNKKNVSRVVTKTTIDLKAVVLLPKRRWSSRTFRYGYLVTTSPQSSVLPLAAPPLRLGHWLWVLPTPMAWRAVCTRPGNAFTPTCWFGITSKFSFMWAGCSPQSELRLPFWDWLAVTNLRLFVIAIVARV